MSGDVGRTCEISAETFRKWESGQNAIDILWLPAICDVGECDVGYLFGEYDTKRKEDSDICIRTGLSKEAVAEMLHLLPASLNFLNDLLASPKDLLEISTAYAAFSRAKSRFDTITADYTRFELLRAIVHFTEGKNRP